MKELIFLVDKTGKIRTKGFAGYEGEHNATRIVVVFDCMPPKVDYFRLYFESASGRNAFTDNLYISDGKLFYDLPYDVTTIAHNIYCQLWGFAANGAEMSTIYKTEITPLTLGGTLRDAEAAATDEFFSSFEAGLNKIDDFNKNFDVQVGIVNAVPSSAYPNVQIHRNGFNYQFDFDIPVSTPVLYLEGVPDTVTVPISSTGQVKTNNADDTYGACFKRQFTPQFVLDGKQMFHGAVDVSFEIPESSEELFATFEDGVVSVASKITSFSDDVPLDRYVDLVYTYKDVEYRKRIAIVYVADGASSTTSIRKVPVTMATNDWLVSSKYSMKQVPEVTDSCTIIMVPKPASANAFHQAGLRCTYQTNQIVTISCDVVPTVAIDMDFILID